MPVLSHQPNPLECDRSQGDLRQTATDRRVLQIDAWPTAVASMPGPIEAGADSSFALMRDGFSGLARGSNPPATVGLQITPEVISTGGTNSNLPARTI